MKSDRSMNKHRARQIIDAYGGNPDYWPSDERDAALALVDSSPDLQVCLHTEQKLDQYIDQDRQTPTISPEQANELTSKITSRVAGPSATTAKKPGFLQNLMAPRFALAMSVMLAVSVTVYMTSSDSPGTQPDRQLAQSAFDNWMFEQVTGNTSENQTTSDLGFMELVELEVDADSNI